jgi:RNA polymerase sigma-70 factor (ECF subfamily)
LVRGEVLEARERDEMRVAELVVVVVFVVLGGGVAGGALFVALVSFACWLARANDPPTTCCPGPTTACRKTNEQDRCHHARGHDRAERGGQQRDRRWVIFHEQTWVNSDERRRRLRQRLSAWLRLPALVDDVSQEACLIAWLRLDRLDKPASFGTWLCRIGVHVVLKRYRRSRTDVLRDAEPLDADGAAEAVDAGRMPYSELEKRAVLERLRREIHALPVRYCSVLTMYYEDELSCDEIARRLQISIAANLVMLSTSGAQLRSDATFVRIAPFRRRPMRRRRIAGVGLCAAHVFTGVGLCAAHEVTGVESSDGMCELAVSERSNGFAVNV